MRFTTGITTAIVLAAAMSTAACGPSEAWPGVKQQIHAKKARAKVPDCAAVWKNAATLPANFKACSNWGVTYVPPRVPCLDGSTLVAFQATDTTAYFGRTGSTITQVAGDYSSTPEWSAAYATCSSS